MKRLLLACILAFTLLPACEKRTEEPPSPEQAPPAAASVETTPAAPAAEAVPAAPTVPLLQEAVETTLVEYPSAALPVWRRYRAQAPALLLVSNNPFLVPTPRNLHKEIADLITNGSDADLLDRTNYAAPDILIQPDMAVSAALDAGLFSTFYWLFPSEAEIENIALEKFREQLLETGLITPQEAENLRLEDGVVSGTVRGLPFQALHPKALRSIDAPAVVHVDLSYFPPLYQGEIKTPLYPLIGDTLKLLRAASLQALTVTISFANVTRDLPLASRFIGPTLATLFSDPALLDADMPIQWRRRGNALYLPNFFQNEQIRNVYLEMEKDDPSDPSVKYGLYQISRDLKAGDQALEYLNQAVALDKAYGLEYLELANVATEKNLPDQSLRMLRLAADTFPKNPFISLHLAQALRQNGHAEEAKAIVAKLQALPWSETYYPAIPEALKKVEEAGK